MVGNASLWGSHLRRGCSGILRAIEELLLDVGMRLLAEDGKASQRVSMLEKKRERTILNVLVSGKGFGSGEVCQ